MGVRVLENQKDFEMVLKEAGCKLVVIDFSATWCGPCKVMKPRFHDVPKRFTANDVLLKCSHCCHVAASMHPAKSYKQQCENDQELAEKNPSVIFCEVDVDDAADIAEICAIKCMPTFLFYKNGEKVFEFSGANRMTLEDKIQELQ